MPKFFVEPEQIMEDTIVITGENVKHMNKVLRLKNEDEITICDGQGIDYKCIIKHVQKDQIETQILQRYETDTEPSIQITLFQALGKSDKMDWVIQKAVELGIYQIVPVITERTVIKIENAKKAAQKIERWNKIAQSAAKQSGRGRIPQVEPIISFSDAITQAEKMDLAMIPYEKEKDHSLKTYIQDFHKKTIGVFIGPEGGFAEKEIIFAQSQQIHPITLGKRILRTETAGLAVLAGIMYETGEM